MTSSLKASVKVSDLGDQEKNALFAKVSQFFSVLADSSRLGILYTVCKGEKSVSEVVAACELSQANVSRHLPALHDCGILARKKVGTTVFYSIADPATIEICQTICGRILDEMNISGKKKNPRAKRAAHV